MKSSIFTLALIAVALSACSSTRETIIEKPVVTRETREVIIEKPPVTRETIIERQ